MKSPISKNAYAIGVLFTLLFSFSITAQVGIGTTSPNSNALLDVDASSTTGGILLPRIALTSTSSPSPLTADVAGMIVYNTATAGDVTPGFYYNDGTDWIKIGSGGGPSDDWKSTGNTGTNSGANFIGTSDAQDVVIKANNTEKLRIGITETVVNEGSDNYNFRIESNNQQNMLFVDGNNDAVGIGTSTPSLYSGSIDVDKFNIVGSGTTTVVGPNTNYTPVSVIVNNGGGVALFAKNEDATNTGPAIEAGGEGAGYVMRVLHLPTSGSGISFFSATNSAAAWAGYFSGDVASTGNYYTVSDKRWKKNIVDLNSNESSLNKIMQLRPKSYQWKTNEFPGMNFNNEKTSFGFIAQEFKEIFPELVTTKAIPNPSEVIKENQAANFKTDYHLVNYIGLIPVLANAMQEQQTIIEKQNNRITELEKAIQEINRKINN